MDQVVNDLRLWLSEQSVFDVAKNMIVQRFVTRLNSHILLRHRCPLQQQHVDYKIAKKRALSQYATQYSSFH
jgi:hypothetical protein